MKKISNKQKWAEIENIERYKIFGHYHLQELKKEIQKGNETIQVLYDLLIKEINRHNGTIAKKVTKIKNTPTFD